jgi:hypothetical protein
MSPDCSFYSIEKSTAFGRSNFGEPQVPYRHGDNIDRTSHSRAELDRRVEKAIASQQAQNLVGPKW